MKVSCIHIIPAPARRCPQLIVQQVRATALKYSKTHGHLGRPIVLLLGDMNSLPQSPPYRAITEADIFAGPLLFVSLYIIIIY